MQNYERRIPQFGKPRVNLFVFLGMKLFRGDVTAPFLFCFLPCLVNPARFAYVLNALFVPG